MSEEKVLTKEIAEQLLATEWQDDFSEFTAVDDNAAKLLAEDGRALRFGPNLKFPCEALIRELNGKGAILMLDCDPLSREQAEALVSFDGTLLLPSLNCCGEYYREPKDIPDDIIELLSKRTGDLIVSDRCTLSTIKKLHSKLGFIWTMTLGDHYTVRFREGDDPSGEDAYAVIKGAELEFYKGY